jgi:hypothetical protein
MTFPFINKTIKQTIKPKSQGYLKDLAYLKLSLGFLNTALQDMLKDTDFNNRKKVNQNRKINKKINLMIESIISDRESIFNQVNKSDRIKASEMAEKLLLSFVKIAPKTQSMNLELIAIYTLWCRYKEKRAKPLHIDFKPFADAKRLFDLAELVCKVDIEDENIEYNLAYELTKVI